MYTPPLSLNNIYNKPNQTYTSPKRINLAQKPDTFELTSKEIDTKNRTKRAVPVEIIETISHAFLLKNDAEEFLEEAEQKAQQLKQEAIDLYNGNNNSNKVSAKIDEGYGIEVVEELLNNGSILRRNIFRNGVLESIDEYNKDSLDQYKFYDSEDSFNFEYKEKVKNSPEGGKTISREIFSYGGINTFRKGYRCDEKGNSWSDKQVIFKDGKINEYEENLIYYKDGTSKVGKRLYFNQNERPEEYDNNVVCSANIPGEKCHIDNKWVRKNGTWVEKIS